MDQLDRRRDVIAVQYHAHCFYGGVLHLSSDDAARYVAETYLAHLPLAESWPAATAVIGAHPEELTHTAWHVAEAQRQRAEQSETAAHQARQLLDSGEPDAAL